MDLIAIAFEAGVVIASAVAAAVIAWLLFRKRNIALWAYLAAFIPRAIIVVVTLTGAENLGILSWLSHTVGAFIYPMLLAMGNILLVEVRLATKVRRESSLQIDAVRAVKIRRFLGRLQKSSLLPKAVEVKNLYIACVMAGMINLAFVFCAGLL